MAFLDEPHLHDMDTSGPQFTWVTRRSNHAYMAARLDRVLVNDEFLDIWQSTLATVLPRISSDQHPILLQLHETSGHVVRPFRFQHMWTSHPSFTHTVLASWAQHTTASNPIQLVTQKLKWLKATLKNWNRITFRNIMFRKTSIGLSSLVIDDELTFDPGIISDSVVQFYTDLFMAQDQATYDDSILGNFIHPVVDPTENDALTALPSVEEIRQAVFDMEPSSSSSPDGFDGAFY
ncbi:hypothetical protein ACS0TY_003514 [Phlomoides rotata]